MAKKRKKTKVVKMQPKLSPKKYIKLKARNLPVVKTYISENIMEVGMGYAVVVRTKRNGDKIVGAYLLDVWCLGVKNAIYKIMDDDELDIFRDQISKGLELVEKDPNYVYNLVYGALEYAEDLGFEPHKDFGIAEYILPRVEEVEYIEIPFGKDGKPTFVNGPHDNAGRVLGTLEKTVGEGNFDYVVEVDERMDYDPFDDDYQDVLDSREFKIYESMALIISDVYKEDYGVLKADFVKDTNLVVQLVLDFVREKSGGEIIEFSQIEKDSVLASAENLIMYDEPDYLMNPEVLAAFRSDGPMKPINDIINVSITNYGDQKLEVLCNLLLQIEYTGEADNMQKFIDDNIQLMEESFDYILEKYSYEAYTILVALYNHISAFGAIDYDRIELKVIEPLM